MTTYAFTDVTAAISGPNGSVDFGSGSANSEGGITVVMTGDKSTLSISADGNPMHSLHADKSGLVTARFQKTSPTNAVLSEMYYSDTESGSATHGRNTITITDIVRGDSITCRDCAFAKFPDVSYAREGGEMVWVWHAGKIDHVLGSGFGTIAA